MAEGDPASGFLSRGQWLFICWGPRRRRQVEPFFQKSPYTDKQTESPETKPLTQRAFLVRALAASGPEWCVVRAPTEGGAHFGPTGADWFDETGRTRLLIRRAGTSASLAFSCVGRWPQKDAQITTS